MSVDSVRAFLQARAPDIEIVEISGSSSTVELAAMAHNVRPAQIAKTICLEVRDKILLVVTSGAARLDNRKVKDVLGGKGRMLNPEEVLAVTGHPVGGVCPFRPDHTGSGLLRYLAAGIQGGHPRGRFNQHSTQNRNG